MSTGGGPGPNRWYRSLYWRIGVSFVVLVVVVLVAQSAVFNFVMARSNSTLPGRSPNTVGAIIAADLSAALAQEPSLEVGPYFRTEYGNLQMRVVVLMKDGSMVANTTQPLRDDLRRSIQATLAGTDVRQTGDNGVIGGPPTVMVPIQVGGELRGMVVLLPRDPQRNPIARDVARLLSVPGTAVLVVGTTLVAFVIFAPVRRRLRALEDATDRLGQGDLSARAPEQGGDEIARVAAAFNRMATELGARSDALQISDQLRRQMLADVSHELKTPLTAMRGYLETLRMPEIALNQATRDRYLDTVERETLRLDRMVRDLLDLARFENGVGGLEARWFDVRRLYDEVLQRHEFEATMRRVSLKASVPEQGAQVFGDPSRLDQVVTNLVANALRHTPEDGTVELSATVGETVAILTVRDSGGGIAPEHLPHVFERFYKVDAARTKGPGGSGLGLSIAKAIVQGHGGTIDVTSVPGRTVFTIELPRPILDAAAHQSTSTNL